MDQLVAYSKIDFKFIRHRVKGTTLGAYPLNNKKKKYKTNRAP